MHSSTCRTKWRDMWRWNGNLQQWRKLLPLCEHLDFGASNTGIRVRISGCLVVPPPPPKKRCVISTTNMEVVDAGLDD